MEPDQKHVEPTHREHLSTGGSADPLIRESIQNSLDVTVGGKVTRVSFTLGESTFAAAGAWFEELWPHLESIANSLSDGLPTKVKPIPYLAIEDFNTTGLEGDVTIRKEVNTDNTKNHFFRFWHRVGPTGELKRRGSWGVGKVAFSNASMIHTFFGLTLRSSETTPLLMGEAGLLIHRIGSKTFDWYGYFARHVKAADAWSISPVSANDAAAFSDTFGLARSEPGLSILVPYIRDELNVNRLACGVIEHYFLSLLAGRLEVTVRDPRRAVTLTGLSLTKATEELAWTSRGHSTKLEMLALIDIARWQTALGDPDYVTAAQIGAEGNYELAAADFPSENLEALTQLFQAGKRIAVRIPVFVRNKEGTEGIEDVRIVLERDESLRKSNVPHIRSGINVSKLRELAFAGARGLLVIGNDPDQEQGLLDKLLQASEGPAHTNWETRGEGYDKAKLLFHHSSDVIRFMRGLVKKIGDLLTSSQDSQDLRTLASFFPDYDGIGTGGGSGTGNKKSLGKKKPTPLPRPKPGIVEGVVLSLAPNESGTRFVKDATVTVERSETSPEEVGCQITPENGRFVFNDVPPSKLRIAATHPQLGKARKPFTLFETDGAYFELILRPESPPPLFFKVPLPTGFSLAGNADFGESLRKIRIEMSYAAWGSNKSFNPADFSLAKLKIAFSGLEESSVEEMIAGPNVMVVTPTEPGFRLSVEGFDVNRALDVRARTLGQNQPEETGSE